MGGGLSRHELAAAVSEAGGLGQAEAPHRVVVNAATEHWLRRDSRGPRLNRALNRLSAPGGGPRPRPDPVGAQPDAGTTATPSRANLPFASSGSPSG